MKMRFTLKSAAALLAAASLVSPAFANEGNTPKGVPQLDHVFIIMMRITAINRLLGTPTSRT